MSAEVDVQPDSEDRRVTRIGAILRCPRCGSDLTISDQQDEQHIACTSGSCSGRTGYPNIRGKPCLIDFEASIFTPQDTQSAGPSKTSKRSSVKKGLLRLAALSEGPPVVTMLAAQRFLSELPLGRAKPRVLVIGGGTVGVGAAAIHESANIGLIVSDVFASDIVDVLCDGHQLPFKDGSIDGVWIQAVLEHVLEPQVVADEIYRVLSRDGIVYAGTPFMQQVHMGAYDFRRFTRSGHRWLFRRFTEIQSGTTSGVGRSLVWSIFYFLRAFIRSDNLWIPTKIVFGWLARLEKFTDLRRNEDGASGTFFIGRKTTSVMTPHDIVRYYSQSRLRLSAK